MKNVRLRIALKLSLNARYWYDNSLESRLALFLNIGPRIFQASEKILPTTVKNILLTSIIRDVLYE